jgi:hypothetical protein
MDYELKKIGFIKTVLGEELTANLHTVNTNSQLPNHLMF